MRPRNPIIPGFAPDPSIVRIQDTYYLVNSSFHLFPGLPIFASRDLLAWRHIGDAINRSTQIDLKHSATCLNPTKDASGEKAPATGGLYAPTIRHYDGVTYIVCTNVSYHLSNDGSYLAGETVFENFVISTTDIEKGHWSDPVYFDFYGIDPDLFFDDDGRVYVSGSSWKTNPSTINCFEIDIKTGGNLSSEAVIWEGHIKTIPEGPHVYKREGYYYLLIAEGGTHEGHCASIARSQSLWGPYESCPGNPILKPSSTSGYSQYHGHGDLVQDTSGNWWMVCLGVRSDKAGRMVLGRETFLGAVEWHENQPWPCIKQPIDEYLGQTGLIKAPDIGSPTLSNIEKGYTLLPSLRTTRDIVWIRKPQIKKTLFDETKNTLFLSPSEGDFCERTDEPVSFVGRRQRHFSGSAKVAAMLDGAFVSPADNLKAGLAYYKDEHRYARIFWDAARSSVVFEILNRAKAPPISRTKVIPKHEVTNAGKRDLKLQLRIQYTALLIHFSCCVGSGEDDEQWNFCGLVDTLDMSGPDFTGPVIGVFATSTGNEWCRFEEFVI